MKFRFGTNETYVVYRPMNAEITSLDLQNSGNEFSIDWYNPRNGGALLKGSVTNVVGDGVQSLGNPPSELNMDWVVLLKKR